MKLCFTPRHFQKIRFVIPSECHAKIASRLPLAGMRCAAESRDLQLAASRPIAEETAGSFDFAVEKHGRWRYK